MLLQCELGLVSPMQISDIHQFYTRNVEVHNMDDMDFIMSSISSSRAAHLGSRTTTTSGRVFQASTLGSLVALFVHSFCTRIAEPASAVKWH